MDTLQGCRDGRRLGIEIDLLAHAHKLVRNNLSGRHLFRLAGEPVGFQIPGRTREAAPPGSAQKTTSVCCSLFD
jgi:hypothetical protein